MRYWAVMSTIFFGLVADFSAWAALPEGFVYLKDIAPTVQEEIRYITSNNFVGHPLPGYEKATCILTRPAAEALSRVQAHLAQQDKGLKVFDCYRPQRTVDYFIEWSQDLDDQVMKTDYYPQINKADVFTLGYVAKRSGHTRGSTVDLTIIDLKTGQPLDMGTNFDFMDERSHPASDVVSAQEYQNRMLLQSAMKEEGLMSISTEWWHFYLKKEPYPDSYFDFKVE